MRRKKKYTRYLLKRNGKVVYVGITSKELPEFRIQQHIDDCMRFTSYC